MEAFEDAMGLVGWDADAGVGNGEAGAAVASGEGEGDASAGVIVFHRVGDEVLDDLWQEDGIGLDADIGFHRAFDMEAGIEGTGIVDGLGDEFGKGDGDVLQREFAGVGLSEEEEFLGDGTDAGDFVDETAAKALEIGAWRGGVHRLFEIDLEDGEGGAQFVGGVGAEPSGL